MKKWLAILLSALLCLLCFSACASSQPEPVLTEEQVESLREEYPVYRVVVDSNVFMDTSVPVEDLAKDMETAIYGKVISPRKWKSISLAGTDHPELEEKRKELTGSAGTAEYLCYEVEVLQDAGGQYQPGDKVVFSIPGIVENTIPEFQEGAEIIFLGAYHDGEENALEDEVGTTFKGIYYVTEDGYALSTCGEDPQTRARASGMKAEDCLNLLYGLTQEE